VAFAVGIDPGGRPISEVAKRIKVQIRENGLPPFAMTPITTHLRDGRRRVTVVQDSRS